MEEKKKLGLARSGQVASSRSRIFGDEDGLPFWVDDRVRRQDPAGANPHLKPLPGYPPETRLVREIIAGSGGYEYLLSDHLYGGWQESERADGLVLIERGNVWRILHDEPTVFRDWREELDCRRLLGDVWRVDHPAGPTVRWHADEARIFIGNGTADAFQLFYPDRPPVHDPDIRLYRFEDREIGRRIAPAALEALSALFSPKPS